MEVTAISDLNRVFCIAAGQNETKKADHPIHRQNLYLNYGLLSLASVLSRAGINAVQIQGNFNSAEYTLARCIQLGLEESRYPILISVPSFYAVSWVNEFITLVKGIFPSQKIVVGGRWVVDFIPKNLQSLIPLADVVVPGVAENIVEEIVLGTPNRTDLRAVNSPYSLLNYELLDQRELYQPSLEVSRGCGMGCNFCQEKDEPLTKLKAAESVVEEARSVVLRDGLNPMNLYFEASIFTPNGAWISKLLDEQYTRRASFHWRTEARVDSILPKHLPALYSAGLRVLDLGLESADPQQLIRMGKCREPSRYLTKASKLVTAAHSVGIQVKVNVLLFPGESEESIQRTCDWLDLHKSYFRGVSVGPVIVFGWRERVSGYIEQLCTYGASVSHSPIEGVTHLNLSRQLDFDASMEMSVKIGKQFMSAEDYYYLKSFSYFSRNYTREQFFSDCRGIEEDVNFYVRSDLQQNHAADQHSATLHSGG